MTDFPENEQLNPTEDISVEKTTTDEFAEYDTIFGDPQAHNDKKNGGVNSGKKRIIALVSAFLAVAVLVGGTVTVIKLIPEKEDTTIDEAPFQDIEVVEYDSNKFEALTVTNPQGTFKFTSKTETVESDSSEDSESKTETVWYADGYGSDVIDGDSIATIADTAASITARRVIDTKTAAECGFDAPVYKIDVTSKELGDYSLIVGANSPDGTGTYLKLSSSDTIYLVDTLVVDDFDFKLLDLAATPTIAGVAIPEGDTKHVDNSGVLQSFDTLTLSGKNFPEGVRIVANDTKSTISTFATYLVKGAESDRIATNTDAFVEIFRSGLATKGAYALDVSPASLASVGLDKPDIIATMQVGNSTRTLKFSLQDDENYAVVADDSKLIHMVNSSYVTIGEYKSQDLLSTWVYLAAINDVSNLSISEGDELYSFDIVTNEDADAEAYTITRDGEKIDTANFQNFYQIVIGMSCADYSVDRSLSTAPSATITFTMTDKATKDVITFTKCSETKYQYAINGLPLGKITSANYNIIMKSVKLLCEGKEVVVS